MFQTRQSLNRHAKILIVDDRLDNLELLSTICTLHGFETITSDCGEVAIKLAKEIRPHVILLDISMPEMDGFTVCQILKDNSITKDIPVIFISILREVRDKTQAFELGGNDYITKPFEIEDVIARINNQLKFYDVQTKLKTKNQELAQERQKRQVAETKMLKLNHKLSQLATLDSLTKIANRSYFEEILAKEWKRGEKENFLLSLILCDLDCFKLYNDYFGYQAGNICLEQVAQTISETINRSGDLVARYSEEEFAIILPQTKAEDAVLVAERISHQVKQLNISHPDSLVSDRITLSFGVTSVTPSSEYNKIQLLATAYKALYKAKKRGRDCIILESI